MRAPLGFVALLSVLPSVAACGSSAGASSSSSSSPSPSPSRAGEPTTGATRQAESRASSVSPLYYALHEEQRPDTFYAAEVGDADDPVILLRQGPPDEAVNEILRLDPTGNPVWSALAMNGRSELTDVRARGAVIAASGTKYLGSEEQTTGEALDVWGFSSGGQMAYEYTGPSGTSGGPLDVCADGTVVASAQGALPGGAAGAFVVALDGMGGAKWSVSLAGVTLTKVKCGGDGIVRVAGSGASGAFAAQVEADGRKDWAWNGTHAASGGSMGIDDAGDVVVATTVQGNAGRTRIALYSLSARGALQWSWLSDGSADSWGGLEVGADGTVTVIGTRTSAGKSEVYVARVDGNGGLGWATLVPFDGTAAHAVGVSVDDSGEAFVCATAGADGGMLLFGDDGTLLSTYVEPSFTPGYADVTDGIGRCIGGAHPEGASDIGTLAFQLEAEPMMVSGSQ